MTETSTLRAFRAAVTRRIHFVDRPVTKVLVAVIVWWYVVQTAVVFLYPDTDLVLWLFTTESYPALSPGLTLAIISHAFFPNVTHFLGNLSLLWLLAGESEQYMRSLEVGLFFVVNAQIAVLAGTAVSGGNTLGASGGILAFCGFYCTHMLRAHRNDLEFETLEEPGLTGTTWRAFGGVCLFLTVVCLPLYLAGQLVGIFPAGRTDVVGHLIGFLCGLGYALLRSVL